MAVCWVKPTAIVLDAQHGVIDAAIIALGQIWSNVARRRIAEKGGGEKCERDDRRKRGWGGDSSVSRAQAMLDPCLIHV